MKHIFYTLMAAVLLASCFLFTACEPMLVSSESSDCNPSLTWLQHFIPMPDSLLPSFHSPKKISMTSPPPSETEIAQEEAKRKYYDQYQDCEFVYLNGSTYVNQLYITHHTHFNCAAKVIVDAIYNQDEGILQYIEEETFPDGVEANCTCSKSIRATVNIPLGDCRAIIVAGDTICINVVERIDTLIILKDGNFLY